MKLNEFSKDSQLSELLGTLGKIAGGAAKAAAITTKRLSQTSGGAGDINRLTNKTDKELLSMGDIDPEKVGADAKAQAQAQKDQMTQQKQELQKTIQDKQKEIQELQKQLASIR